MMTEEEILAAARRAGEAGRRTGSFDAGRICFDANGLVSCIVQDAESGRVLTLAYMNRRSMELSLEYGVTVFWSRSRQELWLKGESSGHFQHIVSMEADCDGDAVLVRVRKDGPACHLGTDSCFDTDLHAEFEESGRERT